MLRSRSMSYEALKSLYEQGLLEEKTFAKVKLLQSIKKELPFPIEPVDDYTPQEIKKLRLREKMTRSEFALYLNTTLKTIQEWEKGTTKPSDVEYKLLNLIMHKGIEIITYRNGDELTKGD